MLLNSLPLSGSSSAMERAAMIQTLQKYALIEKMKGLTMGISDASPQPLINPPAPDWMKDRTSVTPIQDVTPRPLTNPPAPDWMRGGLQGDPIEVVAPKPLINPPAPDELKSMLLTSDDDEKKYLGSGFTKGEIITPKKGESMKPYIDLTDRAYVSPDKKITADEILARLKKYEPNSKETIGDIFNAINQSSYARNKHAKELKIWNKKNKNG